MSMPGFITVLPPTRGHPTGYTSSVNSSLEFGPALSWPCVGSCQTAWSTCISSCQWWEWLIGSCVPKCRAEWLVCVGRC
jgi:hypothetical protein